MKAKSKSAKKKGKRPQAKSKPVASPSLLKGWAQITAFLSQPVTVAQRWVKDGMPVTRQGRFVTARPEELNKWLGREAGGDPLQVATPETDLAAELKRGLAYVRSEKRERSRK